uniref:Uncharacterized protein n=1 Tax=Utricularia reniformis TaxID=192314 RepID=A0A1Y0B4T9_9LAMI|nr:hypothetical protein AEK19_MT2268 [Utricularia reniformis]ART32413.1 hypothetical protein AEK19_MT2268 [Utricularia reniformis]
MWSATSQPIFPSSKAFLGMGSSAYISHGIPLAFLFNWKGSRRSLSSKTMCFQKVGRMDVMKGAC